jgi:small-conductance mechanosensitive channel
MDLARHIDPATLIEIALAILPMLVTLFLSVVVLALAHRWLERRHGKGEGDSHLGGQLALLGLSVVAIVAFILSLPIAPARQGQLLSLLGLLLSGAIALSSTNILGNIMSGFMIRAIEVFRLGDFIQVGDEFGRVSERGLFHIELQTPEGELTTLPNTWMISQPMRVLRSSGTLVGAQVSLGYDVSRKRIEALLIEAAESVGLQDPFVHVVDLGDFSVSYRVSGILRELKKLLATRSRLRAAMLDTLHAASVEIVSPVVEVQRSAHPDRSLIPEDDHMTPPSPARDEAPAEIFDKANAGALRERLVQLRERLTGRISDLEAQLRDASEEQRPALEDDLERARRQLQRLEVALEDQD